MGIPSFYRHLCRRYPALITSHISTTEWLCLDFNCAMYHVLRKMPPGNGIQWESDFCDAIAKYMEQIIQIANPTKGVYVSCDGAVCAAKRRQQRLRRFKGPWISMMEALVTGIHPTDVWDQTALTPGSAFMERLGKVLVNAGKRIKGIPVLVSTATEPGEGEHKLMTRMRLEKPASCVIYGLDADLILLAMLLGADTGASVHLLREAQEFEASSSGWRSLNVSALVSTMIPGSTDNRIRDFVASMTLLGNDFLPRSLTHTVRDDGIPDLIRILQKQVWDRGLAIVNTDGSLSAPSLLAILDVWASHEEEDLRAAALSAMKAAKRSSESDPLKEWNAQPARWATAGALVQSNWRQIYAGWHPGSASNYLQGLAWVWDYYSGRPVDQAWFFEEHLPPLWGEITALLQKESIIRSPSIVYPTPLPDWLHLLAVLPADSVTRLATDRAKEIMIRLPWYWPTSWSVFDIGRTQLWECEPVIPILPEEVLRRYQT